MEDLMNFSVETNSCSQYFVTGAVNTESTASEEVWFDSTSSPNSLAEIMLNRVIVLTQPTWVSHFDHGDNR